MTPRTRASAAWLLAAAVACGRDAAEVPLLADAYKEAAGEIVATLDQIKQTQVRVGDFTPTGFDTTSGQGVAQDLAAALEKAKPGVVKADARYHVNGDVLFVK